MATCFFTIPPFAPKFPRATRAPSAVFSTNSPSRKTLDHCFDARKRRRQNFLYRTASPLCRPTLAPNFPFAFLPRPNCQRRVPDNPIRIARERPRCPRSSREKTVALSRCVRAHDIGCAARVPHFYGRVVTGQCRAPILVALGGQLGERAGLCRSAFWPNLRENSRAFEI